MKEFWYYTRMAVKDAVEAYFQPLRSPWFWAFSIILTIAALAYWK